jgi:aspartyl-tRNA(Asn)/glutamyl-tRNA(Gln) amidotransferase subunit A
VGVTDLASLGATALTELLRRRESSSEDVVRACLARIDRLDPRLSAFITVCRDSALAAARRADRDVVRGRARGPLHGIPFAVKDALWTKGVPTTNGSRLYRDFVPHEDATAVARLRAAGAILLGKLNMMELGFGPTLEPPFGVPRNPWDLARTPGGSSSGSASAVAARLVPVTLGADTGGSIRLPAALCGVIGLKPTRGRVSCHGLMGLCPRFDTVGPLAASVADAALVLRVIAGPDRNDALTGRVPVDDYVAAAAHGIAGMRVGVVRELMDSPLLDAEVRRLIVDAVHVLETAGARVEPVSVPLIRFASEIYVATVEPEAAARLRPHLVTRSQDIDVLPRRRLLTGSLVPASLAMRVAALGERLRAEVEQALGSADVLVAPTTPTAAPVIATASSIHGKEQAWLTAVGGRSLFTNPFNITGHPALSVPCGFTSERLPVGLQLIARDHRESDLLRAGGAYQTLTAWHDEHPNVEGAEG